jgi:hypothetical protein
MDRNEYDSWLRTLVQGQERLVILQEVATERLDRTDATLRRRTQQLDRTDATHAGISATLDRLTTTLECLTGMITHHDTTLDRLGLLLEACTGESQ